MKKIIFTISIILIFTLSIYGEFSKNEIAHINADNVNIRSGPGIKYSSKGFLKTGTPITVLKRSDKKDTIGGKTDYWYLCRYEPGEGWVFGTLISSGYFNRKKYINNLPEPKVLASYDTLKANPWNNCSKQEAEEGNMGCYETFFGEKTIKTAWPPSDEYFQIIEVRSKTKNIIIFKVKLVMSDAIIRTNYGNGILRINGRKKFYTILVKYAPKENTITIGRKKYYNIK